VVENLFVGLWPNRERSDSELANLIAELQHPIYVHREVAEFLRHWSLTQKNAPAVSDITKPFRQKYAKRLTHRGRFSPDSVVTIAVTQGCGTEDDPQTTLINYYLKIWERSPRTVMWREKSYRDLRNALVTEVGQSYEDANNLAVSVFNDVRCVRTEDAVALRQRKFVESVVVAKKENKVYSLRKPLFDGEARELINDQG
jgi:hypothetical protein